MKYKRNISHCHEMDFRILWCMKCLPKLIAALLFCILLISLVSCAGLGSKTPAESEFELGLSLFNRGKYEESVPHFEQATVLQPDFGQAYLYIGWSYVNLGRLREAVQPLKTAFRLSPRDVQREIASIILDVLIHNAASLDAETESRFKGILTQ